MKSTNFPVPMCRWYRATVFHKLVKGAVVLLLVLLTAAVCDTAAGPAHAGPIFIVYHEGNILFDV